MDSSQIYRKYPHLRIGYGGVQGRLKAVSTPAGNRKYLVAEQLTNREVECIVPPELAPTADAAAAEQRRVEMSGKLHRNADGVTQKVEVSWILVMREDHELPSLDELQGSMRGMTGGLTTEEFLRIMRSDGYDDFPEPDDD